MKSCQKCGFSNEDNAKFCKNCGQEFNDTSGNQNCKQCGKPIIPGTRFCKNCGSSVEIKKEPVRGVNTTERVEPKKVELKKTSSQNNSKVIVIVAIAIVILLVVVVFVNQRPKEEDYYSDNQDYIGNNAYYDKDNYEQEESESQDVIINEDEYEESFNGQEVAQSSDYILEGSDYKYLSKSDLYGLTAEECRLARNEIYARHGRMFKDVALQEYFESFDWYYPTIQPDDFEESMLNDYEIANRDLIVEYESEQGYR